MSCKVENSSHTSETEKCSDNDGSYDKSSKSDHQAEIVHVKLQLQALTTSVKELTDVLTVKQSSKILDSISSGSPGSDSLTSQESMEVLKYSRSLDVVLRMLPLSK